MSSIPKRKVMLNESSLYSPSATTNIYEKKGKILNQDEIQQDPKFDVKYFDFERDEKDKKIHPIGSGAFGAVYKGQNTIDHKFYAIKFIKKSKVLETNPSLDIINREINIHKTLVHENIVRLYSSKEDKENFYLFLEYMPEGTLFSYIRKRKKLDEATSFNLFMQIVSAVSFLHKNSYAHRDIKPENILLKASGKTCKLCDFGWCIDLKDGQRETFCGTYEYMAPELVKSVPYDMSIDAWGLGVLLYEMLHGYSPFRVKGGDYKEIFKNIMGHKVVFDNNLTKECKDLISGLLNEDNEKRMKVKDIFNTEWVNKMSNQNNPIQKDIALSKAENKVNIEDLLELNVDNNPKQKKVIKKTLNSDKNIKVLVNKDNNVSDKVPNENIKKSSTMQNTDLTSSKDFSHNEFCLFRKTNSSLPEENQDDKDDIKVDNQMKNKIEHKIEHKFENNNWEKSVNENKNNANQIDSKIINFEVSEKKQKKEDRKIPRTDIKKENLKKASTKVEAYKDKVMLEETSTFFDSAAPSAISSEFRNTISILQKAEMLKEQTDKKPVITNPTESFWDKIFSPFKCGK